MERRDEAGFTIVEVMVTTFLVLIVSITMLGFLDTTTQTTGRAGANVEAEREAQLVLRTMGQDIRSAASISTVYPGTPVCPTSSTFASPYTGFRNCISIRIARPEGGDETCPHTDVVYGLSGQVLRSSRREYKLVSGTCTLVTTTASKVEMSDVVNPATTGLFAFYDRTGNDMIAASRLPTTAASVKITLVKRYRKANTPNLTLSSVVALRNNR